MTPPTRPHARLRVRPGYTLPEAAIALAVAGILAALAIAATRALLDRAAARMAAADLASLLAEARDAALASGTAVAARADTTTGSVMLLAGRDTLVRRLVGPLHDVRLTVTRDSLVYGALGLGRGLANARWIVRRGAAAETVLVSRLGRVRVGSE